MTTFIDMSWKVDEDRRQREVAREEARVERVQALIFAEQQRREQGGAIVIESSCTVDKRQDTVLQRLGWWQRVKEFLRPCLRRKRALEEFAIAQHLRAYIDEPIELPSWRSDGLETLKECEERPRRASSIDDSDVTRGSEDDKIAAVLPIPGTVRRGDDCMPTGWCKEDEVEDEVEEPSLEDLADQAMDEALAAADAPGNRSSTRPALPAEWMTSEPKLWTTGASSSDQQQTLTGQTDFLPRPSAVFSLGSVPLPSFLDFSTGSRLATARSETEEAGDSVQGTPASGEWFGGVKAY